MPAPFSPELKDCIRDYIGTAIDEGLKNANEMFDEEHHTRFSTMMDSRYFEAAFDQLCVEIIEAYQSSVDKAVDGS